MRGAGLWIVVATVLAAPSCGAATAPSSVTSFAIDAGNYTLKLSGSGLCSQLGTPVQEGSAAVVVTRAGTAWSVRAVQTADTFAMSLTTEGTAAGSVRGEISGALSAESEVAIIATGSITGSNSTVNVAGGPISTSGVDFVVRFSQPAGGASCTVGTWTLTPR